VKATFYNWKVKYGGLEVSEAKRLKGLESEDAKLKKLLAGRHAGQCGAEGSSGKKMVTPAAKREAVAHVCSAFGLSEWRACRMIGCVRMTVRYSSRRPPDTESRERLKALAHERRRFGYRRLLVLLRREGFTVNHKRLFRALVTKTAATLAMPPKRLILGLFLGRILPSNVTLLTVAFIEASGLVRRRDRGEVNLLPR
jgi:putative transposase